MAKKINSPIVDYAVVKPEDEAAQEPAPGSPQEPDIQHMHEQIERPESLVGRTYKIKTPLSEHALYVTINDVVLNPGTEHEIRRPFEIFINSKNMDHFQWIVALTRIVSAVFRKGGDCTFLAEELRSVFDPRGGYFKKGGRFMPSLVAEIGDVIEQHLREIGMMSNDGLDEHQRRMIEQKRAELDGMARSSANDAPSEGGAAPAGGGEETAAPFPAGASLCGKCHTKACVQMDGCLTCLNCGDSKCQ